MSETPARREVDRRPRRRRSHGERTRNAILDEAARLATVEGIGGLSIGRLADAVGMSKSGLYAHFGSKEELQLATVDTAASVFAAQVVEPAASAPNGLERLRRLVDGYLRYVEVDTFPGGCFFASVLAEMDTHPGAVPRPPRRLPGRWLAMLETAVRDAQADGAIDPADDAAQLAFEVEAALLLANTQFVASRTQEPIERARRSIERRLGASASSLRDGAGRQVEPTSTSDRG
jgi:Transcriptional regulator